MYGFGLSVLGHMTVRDVVNTHDILPDNDRSYSSKSSLASLIIVHVGNGLEVYFLSYSVDVIPLLYTNQNEYQLVCISHG